LKGSMRGGQTAPPGAAVRGYFGEVAQYYCPLGFSRSLPLYGGCHRRKPIAVGSQIIGGLLHLIGRQQSFGSRRRHVVHRGKGAIERTAGQQDSRTAAAATTNHAAARPTIPRSKNLVSRSIIEVAATLFQADAFLGRIKRLNSLG
jgi:hypothetical protein